MDKKIFAFIIFFLIFAALSNPLEASRHHQGRSSAGRRALSPQADESVEKSPGRINDAYVIHFILDGTNAEAFENAREKGLLPNISNMFFENGAVFEKGLSLFPSTSTTVYQSYATGLLPGRSGIPHLQRMDRNTMEVVDYMTISGNRMMNSDLINTLALINPASGNLGEKTSIFELLEGHPSAAIYSSFYRGASYVYPKIPIKALWSAYVSGNREKVDDLALKRVMKIFSNDDAGKIPRYTLVGLYSSDIVGHHFGPKSPEVEGVLARFDLFLAQFDELLGKRGLKEKTYIVVTADHGMHESGRLFKLQKELEEKGAHFKPRSPKDKKFIIFAADRGVVSTHIYVRHDGGFEPLTDPETLRSLPSIHGGDLDLIKSLLELEATEFVIVRRGERNSRIFSKDGKSADIDCFRIGRSDYCSYEFDRSLGDPFNYSSNPELSHLLDG
ncbi:MAG TPA: alkaline phosphatase family protein, partial [bacterium]|nr:alkaline phosphatase family protein [bacterium]